MIIYFAAILYAFVGFLTSVFAEYLINHKCSGKTYNKALQIRAFALGFLLMAAIWIIKTDDPFAPIIIAFLIGYAVPYILSWFILNEETIKQFIVKLNTRSHPLEFSAIDDWGQEHWRCRRCRQKYVVPIERTGEVGFSTQIRLGRIIHMVPLIPEQDFWEKALAEMDFADKFQSQPESED